MTFMTPYMIVVRRRLAALFMAMMMDSSV